MACFGCCYGSPPSSASQKTGEECLTAKRSKKRSHRNSRRRSVFGKSDTAVEANRGSAIFVLPVGSSVLDGDYDFQKSNLRRFSTTDDDEDESQTCSKKGFSPVGAKSRVGCLKDESSNSSPGPPRPTSLAFALVSSTPLASYLIMFRHNSEVFAEGMAPVFGNGNNGTLRSTSSTVTTPLSTATFIDAQHQHPTNGIINGFDYNEKLNGTLKTNKLKAFRTSSNGGSIAKHLRIHKLPQPHRCELVFKSLDDALKECMVVTQQDIDSLRDRLDSADSSTWPRGAVAEEGILEAQKQLKAAERYSKRLAFHGSRIDELRDLYDSQLAAIPDGETQPLSSVVKQRQQNQKSFSATNSFKGVLKDLVHVLCKLEAELEMLAGTLSVEVKGVAGFARLAPGDVFEVQLKCGVQKWKSKVKIGSDKKQVWDAEAVIFKCLLEDLLEIKVFEHKGFGKSVLLIEKTFDPLQLFRAHPQLITLDLNRNGSLKLSLQSTWNPLDGLLTPLTTANDLIHSSLTLNGGSKSVNSNSSSLRGKSKSEQQSEPRSGSMTYNSVADMSIFENGNSRRSPLMQNGRSNCNGLSRNGSTVSSALITTPPPRASSPLISCTKNGSLTPSKSSSGISSDSLPMSNGGAAMSSLFQILRRLKPIIHASIARFPELATLEDIIFTLDALLANSTLGNRFSVSQNGRRNRADRTSVGDCYGTLDRLDYLRLRNDDFDDLDNNILNKPSTNGLRVQFSADRVQNGNGNGNGNGSLLRRTNDDVRRIQDYQQQAPPSPSSSASSASIFNHDTPTRRRRYLKKGESSPATGSGNQEFYQISLPQHETPSLKNHSSTLERPRSSIFEQHRSITTNGDDNHQGVGASFGSPELDVCLFHHLLHCEMLLHKLVGFGPLHHCEQEALCKLTVETSILAYLTPLSKPSSPMNLPKITQLLNDLDANTELQDVWLSAAGTGSGGYFLPSVILRRELRRSYGHIVQAKYEELIDKVFDKVLHLLTDRSSWDPDIVTVFQFVYCFHEKQLIIFIESLAHETWIVETINCRVRAKIQRVIERLKHVPVPPPPDVLRHIGLVLADENADLRTLAESYLLHAQGALRADLVATYLAFLEHEDAETRRGACRALAVLNARRCVSALAFISHNDRKVFVREEARRAVLTFGAEGNMALNNSEQRQRHVGEGVSGLAIDANNVRF